MEEEENRKGVLRPHSKFVPIRSPENHITFSPETNPAPNIKKRAEEAALTIWAIVFMVVIMILFIWYGITHSTRTATIIQRRHHLNVSQSP